MLGAMKHFALLLVVLGSLVASPALAAEATVGTSSRCLYGDPSKLPTRPDVKHLQARGKYFWTPGTGRQSYQSQLCALWFQDTAQPRLFGLETARRKVREISANAGSTDKQYLRREGGKAGKIVWLEVREDGKVENLRTMDAVRKEFKPITTVEAVFALLSVQTSDLVLNTEGKVVGHMLPLKGGYLVNVFKANTFGCGWHEPTGALYFVRYDGTVDLLAEQRLAPGGTTCVD